MSWAGSNSLLPERPRLVLLPGSFMVSGSYMLLSYSGLVLLDVVLSCAGC